MGLSSSICRKILLAILTISAVSRSGIVLGVPTRGPVVGFDGHVRIYGHDNISLYLGCFTCKKQSGDSIFNKDSEFNSQDSKNSFYNPEGPVGDVFSDYSPCNIFGKYPPELWGGYGQRSSFYGYLTLDTMKSFGICNAGSKVYWSEGCKSLTDFCRELP